MKRIAILGSTGTIGVQALEVLSQLDTYEVVALAAGRNVERLAEQIRQYRPKLVGVADEEARRALRELVPGERVDIVVGDEGLVACAAYPSDVVLNAVVGARGILPALAAVGRGARLALANKECLVAAGELILRAMRDAGGEIVPVDSEHCALHQCLRSGRPEEVLRLVLTASGGPFRSWPKARMAEVTVRDALRHPNWNMGQKITIDSATMMNKGLEVIEAHHLFAVPYDKIAVLVHPESIVHSMVEFVDGSMVAQLATADMRLPIQYAITYPERLPAPWPRLNLASVGALHFEEPDLDKFPCLRLAIEAGRAGGIAPCVLNAANEVAVDAFLREKIPFLRIPQVVQAVLERVPNEAPQSVDDVLRADGQARRLAELYVAKGG
ncbi:1-deoxy-D-xylulose-5-phosphate reductoisomerase [Alicyclobacillus acidocaldarius]|uniref:1-deoxy-D-xylulose 5-phosphate reductoisomerase n=1 Tax=Alicyclobacillus acidocaldarius subsp. acidocaldarius (strain ATCC 27009 / DSM 446 / BCRC 14685 / JCM 5260 / KCTC 1825 / NBRC 15652 / NCIMB 11725 / NRRL B-14509 / 104-IA) TaxID=521098 RepID=C8WWI0_ALIAD|nr:1-deoxy-D-xylulose-5-phosphate reductoisomerase [Alicyclobacillus acidocaldarius]ACV58451.1 1-deoxy-D-xylulose 5-phosphate reductoisomerase [Alicyclobacillus acidocaldarius subsp. acidocaldarius DSM 446]